MKEDSELRTPNSELSTGRSSLDEILSQLALTWPQADPGLPTKVLFLGKGTGGISSYAAGWIVSKGMDVIVLDGANRFDPYMVSSVARRARIPPERLLRNIRIARAFTCYQMATLIEERLAPLIKQEESTGQSQKPWVILLGPITTFLDEDVPEREAGPLFERTLRKAETMVEEGISFLLFQPSISPNFPRPSFAKGKQEPDYSAGRAEGLRDSRRGYLMRRLFQFSNLVWTICMEDQGPKIVLEKGLTTSPILGKSSKSQAPIVKQ